MTDDVKKLELLPCPFCGLTPKVRECGRQGNRYWEVECEGPCAILPHGSGFDTREEALKAWNTGSATESLRSENEKLNQMLRDTGYGQGQIDAYAEQCERVEKLEGELREAREMLKEPLQWLNTYYGANKDGMSIERVTHQLNALARILQPQAVADPTPGKE